MKKVLIFSLSYYPRFIGGAEVAIKEITDRIPSEEISFDMITLQYDSNLPAVEKIGNVTVYRIGFGTKNPTIGDLVKFPMYLLKVFYPPLAFFKAMLLDKKFHYDGCWAMMSYTGFPVVFLRLFYRRIPYILTLQEGDTPDYMTGRWRIRMVYPFYKLVFLVPNTVQVISNFLGSWARGMGYKGQLEVIPNGVDTKHFSQQLSGDELQILKQKLGKKDNDIFLITTSRLVKKNAVDDVIKSLVFLPENYKFLVLGIGPDEKMLKNLTEKLNVAKRVNFLGEIPNRDLPKYLQISDIFVRPSRSEGMGNVFIEAFAAGIPVIATQEGGIADFLFDPDLNKDKEPTGRAVKTRDPEGIARQIKACLENPNETKKIVENAKKMTMKIYDWNLIAKNMKDKVFDAVLK